MESPEQIDPYAKLAALMEESRLLLAQLSRIQTQIEETRVEIANVVQRTPKKEH